MTGTDIALYRSSSTYATLASRGVAARPLSTEHPADGIAIDIPSGYWKQSWACTVNGYVPELREDGYVWKDSMRYSSGCSTPHGSSGSPVVNRSTGEVVAINNTGNDDGERCTINNPCEVDASGRITVIKGQSYAQQTYPIAPCYSAGRVDLTRPGCTLFGAAPAPTPTPTPPPTPTPGTNLLTNPGFESGTQGWTGTSGPITNNAGQAAHDGQWKAWLGGNGSRATEQVTQNVTIPAGARTATLTYWVHVDTAETTGTRYDTFAVKAGTTTVDSLSNLDAASGYRQRTVDLTAYAGRTVALAFTATEDDSAQTSFVVDDVSLTAG